MPGIISRKILFTIVVLNFLVQLKAQTVTIPIEPDSHAMVLQTDSKNLLRTIYFGKRLMAAEDYSNAYKVHRLDDDNAGIYNAAYTPSGTWNLAEPAIQVKHGDGNLSLELKYVNSFTGAS